MFKVDPIIIVHIAIIYPIMLALLALLSKVCKKAANPICERDHPKATRPRSTGEVLVKKLLYNTKAPMRKNMILVVRVRKKLNIK